MSELGKIYILVNRSGTTVNVGETMMKYDMQRHAKNLTWKIWIILVKKLKTKDEKFPFCPSCENNGSSFTSKFCSLCGTSMFRSRWDDDFDCVVYECMKTGLSQLEDPREKVAEDEGSSSFSSSKKNVALVEVKWMRFMRLCIWVCIYIYITHLCIHMSFPLSTYEYVK